MVSLAKAQLISLREKLLRDNEIPDFGGIRWKFWSPENYPIRSATRRLLMVTIKGTPSSKDIAMFKYFFKCSLQNQTYMRECICM